MLHLIKYRDITNTNNAITISDASKSNYIKYSD